MIKPMLGCWLILYLNTAHTIETPTSKHTTVRFKAPPPLTLAHIPPNLACGVSVWSMVNMAACVPAGYFLCEAVSKIMEPARSIKRQSRRIKTATLRRGIGWDKE
jgi:hypothetical protein